MVAWELASVVVWIKGYAIVMDGLPTWQCRSCDARYREAPLYRRLEGLARQAEGHQLLRQWSAEPADLGLN
jgi:hypothetical protein